MVFKQRWGTVVPPGHLAVSSLVITTGEQGVCDCHLVGGSQRCCYVPYNTRTASAVKNCPLLSPGWQCGGPTTPGVTVKDVNQRELVRVLAAFLRRSGKLERP